MVAQTLQDPTPAAAPTPPPPSPVHLLTCSPVPSSPTATPSPIPDSPVHLLTCSPVHLPPLSPHESELLSSFLILRYDLVALAESNKLNPLELLAFARSPAVQAHLAELKKFADQAFALRSLESRTNAINLLEEVAKTSDNPIEKRRAASAILRGLNPVGGVPRGDVPRNSKPSDTPRLHPPHRQAWRSVADATETENPFNRHPTSPNSPSPAHLFTPSPVHPPSDNSALSTQHSALPTTPSPNFSDNESAEVIGAALKSLTERDFETLHAFTTPETTLGEAKAPADKPTFNQVLRTIIPRRPCTKLVIHRYRGTETSADFLCSLCEKATGPSFAQFLFTLTRSPDSKYPNSWLLSSFKRKPNPPNTG